ncbi:hypothetical protein DSO57_1038173 [Entomophthora muscae]|uniref:Uncharacterized protein n=1 Tax=Entomophthora muscae TaxID=34485 RepID=A0ACC2TY99_9FUNG|nr:hypothetical protein DSO57_1038173 [Entomophthora muscae]
MNIIAFILSQIISFLEPGFIGIRLPAVVDLNQEFQKVFPDVKGVPSRYELSFMEPETVKAGIIKMKPTFCDAKYQHMSPLMLCGSISAGNPINLSAETSNNTEEKFNKNSTEFSFPNSLNDSEKPTFKVPLLILLAYSERSLSKAREVIKSGINFGKVTNLVKPKCGIISALEYIFDDSGAKKDSIRAHRQALKENIKDFISKTESLQMIGSNTLGNISLTLEHLNSISSVARMAINTVATLDSSKCLPVVKIIAAACFSSKVHAVYGKDAKVLFDDEIDIDGVILPNASVTDEYFTAIVSCAAI